MPIYLKLNRNIRIADLGGISNRIVDFLKDQNLVPYAEYAQIMPDLQTLTEAFTVAMDRDQIESELSDLDAVRDKALSDLNKILKGYASIAATEVREPARQLLATFDKYGLAIANYRYDAQSGKMQSLLKDFATPEATANIAALPHVKSAIDTLSKAQQMFETKKITYDQAIENRKENTQSATAIKPQLLDVINNKLVNYHIAMVQFKDANFKHIADTVNNWITNANRNRQTSQEEPEVQRTQA